MAKFKIDMGKILGIGTIALGIASTILSNAKEKNDQKLLKKEITKEVLKDLSSNQ